MHHHLTIRTLLYRIATTLAFSTALAAAFMMFKHHERNQYLQRMISQSLSTRRCLSRDDTVLTLARNIFNQTNNVDGVSPEKLDWYDRWESTSWFNMSSSVALKYGAFGVHGHYVFGPCGTMSRLLLNSLWQLGVPARKLQLLDNAEGRGGGHTLVEYEDAGKWKVIATSDSSFVWRNKNGAIADVSEIQQQPSVFAQIYAQQPRYPYLFDNPQHLNWTRFPHWVRASLSTIFSEEQLRSWTTPSLYEQPRLLLFYLFVMLFIASSTWALQLRDQRKLVAQHTPLRASYNSAHRCLRKPDSDLRSSRELKTSAIISAQLPLESEAQFDEESTLF